MYNRVCGGLAMLCISVGLMTSCGTRSTPEKTQYSKLSQAQPGTQPTVPSGPRINEGVLLMEQNMGGLADTEVRSRIAELAAGAEVEARNAALDEKTWDIIPGRLGKRVNVEKTLDLLKGAASGEKISLAVDEYKPPVTSELLKSNLVIIGSYTTPILNRAGNRVNNIEVASEEMDYLILQPGEVFSFNEVLGRRTRAKGYEKAPIIKKSKQGKPEKAYGVGGGVCQVSTTIFNAAEESGLQIIERHPHSKDVGYVPKGEDATVNYGALDFKFKNSRNYPIMIRIFPAKKTLTVKIIENRN